MIGASLGDPEGDTNSTMFALKYFNLPNESSFKLFDRTKLSGFSREEFFAGLLIPNVPHIEGIISMCTS